MNSNRIVALAKRLGAVGLALVIFWHVAQKNSSASTRSSSDRWPSENSVRHSSLYSSASW